MATVRDDLLEGRRALEAAEWQAAHDVFYPRARGRRHRGRHEGIGLALWFLGNIAEGIAARERAFELYVRERRCDDAARIAVWVSHQHLLGGRASAARGWLARAERALEGVDRCAGHGWVAVERARHAIGVEDQIKHASRAMEIARETGAEDLEVFALSLLGRAEVSAGRRERGIGAARGGDGVRGRRPGAQRPHARRGVLQPDHGLHQRGGMGARDGVVRIGRRVRAHA